jgi:HAD superfamily hydrolase (TIGR01662 family)
MAIKAVFFDFGCTLAERSIGNWRNFEARVVSSLFGLEGDRLREFWHELSTVPASEEERFLERKCAELGVPIKKAGDYMRERGALIEGFAWEPGAISVLEELKSRGVRTGIISNTDGVGLGIYDKMRPDARPLLDAILLSSEERLRKPDKRLFTRALERVGVGAGDALHVGDDELTDIKGAHNAGMKAVLYDPNGEAKASKADYVIRDLKEILKLV